MFAVFGGLVFVVVLVLWDLFYFLAAFLQSCFRAAEMEGGVAVKMRLPRFINPYIVSVVLADFGYRATHQNCSAEH